MRKYSRTRFPKICQIARWLEIKRMLTVLVALTSDCESISLKSRSALNSGIKVNPERIEGREGN
jgi:hypothetical protein